MSNKKFDPFRRLEELPSRVYVILGILCLAIHVILCTYTDIPVAVCGLILIGIYIVSTLIITMVVHKRINIFRNASNYSEEQNNGVIYTFRHLLKIPYAVVTEKGKIITVNAAMKNAAGAAATVFNADIKDSCGISMDAVIKHMSAKVVDEEDEIDADEVQLLKEKVLMCKIGDRFYHIDCHPLFSKGKMFYLLMFRDITEHKELSETHRALHTAVAYIVIDNLDEIAQYAQVSYQAEVARVDSILKDWAKELGGIIREYDRHKYVLLLTRQSLLTCVKNKFEILDKVRQITLGDDNMPITVSVGVTTLGDTLARVARMPRDGASARRRPGGH